MTLIAYAILAAAALAAAPAALAQTPEISFKADIAPVLKVRCATCHLTGKEAGNLALHPRAAYDTLVGVAASENARLSRVVPGKPEASYLLMKLDGTHLDNGGSGTRMPMGAPPLDPATRKRIRDWIVQGAKNN